MVQVTFFELSLEIVETWIVALYQNYFCDTYTEKENMIRTLQIARLSGNTVE